MPAIGETITDADAAVVDEEACSGLCTRLRDILRGKCRFAARRLSPDLWGLPIHLRSGSCWLAQPLIVGWIWR